GLPAKGGSLSDYAFRSNYALNACQFLCQALIDSDHFVEGIRNLAGHPCPIVRQLSGKISALECGQGCKQLLAIEPVAVGIRVISRSKPVSRGIFLHRRLGRRGIPGSRIRRVRSEDSYSSVVD